MNSYDILTSYNYSQTHCVVAKSIADAEKIFKLKYHYQTILEIKLHSNYVQIQGIDDKTQDD